MNLETFQKTKVTKDLDGFYYTNAYWIDANLDGKLDLITARSNKPLGDVSELLWLEQP